MLFRDGVAVDGTVDDMFAPMGTGKENREDC